MDPLYISRNVLNGKNDDSDSLSTRTHHNLLLKFCGNHNLIIQQIFVELLLRGVLGSDKNNALITLEGG